MKSKLPKVRYCKLCGKRLGNTTFNKCLRCRLDLKKVKTTLKKIKKEKSPKYLRKACMDMWTKKVKEGGKCEVCGRTRILNAHHIVSRKNLTLRYDLRNGCCLCAGCHKLYAQSAHEDPIWFVQWMMQNRPDDYNYLFEKREELTTFIDYNAILKGLIKCRQD